MQSIIQFEGCHELVIVVDVIPLSTTCEGIEMGLSRIAGGEWSREDYASHMERRAKAEWVASEKARRELQRYYIGTRQVLRYAIRVIDPG